MINFDAAYTVFYKTRDKIIPTQYVRMRQDRDAAEFQYHVDSFFGRKFVFFYVTWRLVPYISSECFAYRRSNPFVIKYCREMEPSDGSGPAHFQNLAGFYVNSDIF